MSRLRLRLPTPALVVSCVALIVALGGTSYAAFSVPNGSVGTSALRNKAVTNAKLGPLSVGTAKLRDGSVTAGKINPSGLTVPNATNAVNATNATTLTSIQIVRGPSQSVPANSLQASTVTCPTGTSAIGAEQVNLGNQFVSTNEVSISGRNALVFINNLTATPVTWHAYAVCVNGSSTGASLRAASDLQK